MTRFARFLEALGTSRQLEASLIIRRYSYLIEQAHTHEEKERLEAAGKNAAAAQAQPSFIAGLPLYNP